MIYYELQAELSEYPGNHERELTAWVFGAESEYMTGGWERQERPHAEAMAWAYDPEGMEGTLQQFAHEEYGMVWQDIGTGINVVHWRLEEAPTDEQWQALWAAFNSFEVPPKSYAPNPAKVTVKKLSLVKVETTYSLEREDPA